MIDILVLRCIRVGFILLPVTVRALKRLFISSLLPHCKTEMFHPVVWSSGWEQSEKSILVDNLLAEVIIRVCAVTMTCLRVVEASITITDQGAFQEYNHLAAALRYSLQLSTLAPFPLCLLLQRWVLIHLWSWLKSCSTGTSRFRLSINFVYSARKNNLTTNIYHYKYPPLLIRFNS